MTPEEIKKKSEEAKLELALRQQGVEVQSSTPSQQASMSLAEKAAAAKEELFTKRQNMQASGVTPEAPPSVLDRVIKQPYERAQQRMVGTMERAMGPTEAQMQGASVEQQYQMSQAPSSTVLQVAATPVSLTLDVLGSSIGVGAGAAWSLAPESAREGVSEFFVQMAQTSVGQKAIKAAMSGADSWKTFKEKYPEQSANIEAGLDIFGGVPRNIVKDSTVDLRPLVLERVGLRNELKPLAGIDKDVYNIAYSGPTQKKTVQQAELTTDPKGILGIQGQRATQEQLDVVDELKRAGINGSKTLQQNFNSLISHLDKLDDELIGKARNIKKPISVDNITRYAKEELAALREAMPDLFQTPEINRKVEQAYAKMMAKLEDQGLSVEGVIQARRAFDSEMKRQGVDVGSSKINPSVVTSRAIRNATNRAIAEVMPESTDLFTRRSRLLGVYDNIGNNAANEAATRFGRYVAELGLDTMSGENFTSRLINGAYILGFTPIITPYYWMKKTLKRPSPARGRAKVAYVLRDVKDEIDKAIASTKDPNKKRALLLNKPVVFASLEEAARTLMEEEDY